MEIKKSDMAAGMKIKIGNCFVGDRQPCFIIAEAGVNHNGDIELARKMIDLAKAAGADAVKFQFFRAQDLASRYAPMAGYQIKNLGLSVSQYDMLKRLELSQEGLLALKRYCGKKGIIFLATPHTESAVDFLGPLMPAYKVASADLTNLPLLRKISRKKKPMILSTGMSTLAEIKQAVAAVRKEGNNSFILLHCTSAYPCPLQEVNLKAMQTIRKKYNCLVGYSDHTLGNTVAIMAVAMGAVVLEKHLTLDKDLPGPDHKASLEPGEFKELVSAIRDAEKSMGCGIKKPSAGEVRIAKSVRKSLVAAVDIPKGAKISRDMLCIKRPGSGIAPGQLNKAIGRKAASNIIKDTPLTWQKLKR